MPAAAVALTAILQPPGMDSPLPAVGERKFKLDSRMDFLGIWLQVENKLFKTASPTQE